jgi:hypothetical protein
LLYKINDCENYALNCDKTQQGKTVIKSDYIIQLREDTLFSIEYITEITNLYENRKDTIYQNLVFNPQKIKGKNMKDFLFIEPENVISNFDRELLLPYVDKYNKLRNKNINILAYKKNSNYFITWGITKTDFILYVGGEGEGIGYDKILIPLTRLKKNYR